MIIFYKVYKYLKKHRNIVKDILMGAVIVIMLICVGINKACIQAHTEETTILETHNDELQNKLNELNNDTTSYKHTIEEQAELIKQMQSQIDALQAENKELMKSAACSVTYPDTNYLQSKYIWNYLTLEIGLNKYVAAGIMGNIMTEVGGQTLDISMYSCRESNSGKYYGICQWAGDRKDRLLNEFGGSLDAQCRFIQTELLEIFPDGDEFYDITDEKEAALQFAKYFERCAEWSYNRRQTSATKALEYFTGNN